MLGGSFNKKEDFHVMLVLGIHQVSRSLHLPARILKVYYLGSVTYSVQTVSTAPSFVLETASNVGMVGRMYFPKTVGKVRSL